MKSLHVNISKSISRAEEEIIRGSTNSFCEFLHHHDEMQISYMVACEGDVFVEDYKGKFQGGDVFVVGSNQAHLFKENEQKKFSTHTKMYSVFVDLNCFNKNFSHIPEFQSVILTLRKYSTGAKFSHNLKAGIFQHIVKIVESDETERLIHFLNLIHSMSQARGYEVLSSSEFSAAKFGFDQQRLDKVIKFTKSNLSRAIRLEEAAEVAFLTPESFCKYFKNKTGKTYIQYVNELRVSTATQFLIQENLNLSEICAKVGFSNMSYFNRIFKKIKGATPKEFQISLS
jgi:YesN/AraC family two-component response regulator